MNKTEIKNLDLDLYKETLDNGLTIYICPIDRNDAHASIVTKYGNDILEYKPIGKNEYKIIPTGTAHFLEHKMFAKEEGPDAMSIFTSNGADSNAYTSSKTTRYYYTTSSKFFENLKTLLDCITKPYFTKENIEKEQGIIQQEIKMGQADPFNKLYYTSVETLFQNHPHKYPVVGYIDSIKKITAEDLYDTYNTFYHPNNLFMVITGNVNPQETIKFIKDYFTKIEYPKQNKIDIKKYDEPKQVAITRKEVSMDVTNKLMTLAYKIPLEESQNKFKTNMYISLYLDMLFGPMSKFFDETFKDKNILKNVYYYKDIVDKFLIVYFDVEVLNEEDIINKIDKLFKSKEYNEEDFKILIKNNLKSLIITSEHVENMANFIVNQELEYNEFYTNIYEKYKALDYEEFKEYINVLDFTNSSLSVISKAKG